MCKVEGANSRVCEHRSEILKVAAITVIALAALAIVGSAFIVAAENGSFWSVLEDAVAHIGYKQSVVLLNLSSVLFIAGFPLYAIGRSLEPGAQVDDTDEDSGASPAAATLSVSEDLPIGDQPAKVPKAWDNTATSPGDTPPPTAAAFATASDERGGYGADTEGLAAGGDSGGRSSWKFWT